MKILALLSLCTFLVAACGPHAGSNTNLSAKTNVNATNSVPYSRTENAYTFAQNSDLARDLTPSGKAAIEIVGKTVSQSKLWQNKKFDTELRKLMGADYPAMKKYWNTETPIKKFGDFLMMTGCEQNNCAFNQYVIFMDLGDGRINVIHISKDASKEWHRFGKIEYLPPPFAEELEAMRARK